MDQFGEMLKASMSILEEIQNEPEEGPSSRSVNRIYPALENLENEPSTENDNNWASEIPGSQGVLSSVRNMASLGKVVVDMVPMMGKVVDTFVESDEEDEDDDIFDTESFNKWTTGILEVFVDNNKIVSLADLVAQIMSSYTGSEKVTINKVPKDLFSNDASLIKIKILIWPPNMKSTGHVACDLSNGSKTDDYFSFWPKAEKSNYWYGVHDCKMSTYERDVRQEKVKPTVFHLHKLNKWKMINKSKEIKRKMEDGTVKYEATIPINWNGEGQRKSNSNIMTHNCCTVIWSLLVAGGIQDLIDEHIFHLYVNFNPVSNVGHLTQAVVPVLGIDTTANPWSMLNLITVATHAERRELTGLPRLAIDN